MLARIEKLADLQEILNDSTLENVSRFVLGGGSNVLFTKPVDGLVLKIELMGQQVLTQDENTVIVEAGAGENWHALVQWTIGKGFGGLENLSLIPGNVGASPMQNIGAYGVEIKDHFHSLLAVDINDGSLREFSPEECEFGYRESVFKRSLKDRYIIASVRYRLDKNPQLNTSYGAIEAELERMGVDTPSVATVSQAVINIRRSKLPDPAELGNAGSFFKNPTVDIDTFNRLIAEHPKMPHYPTPEGRQKLAAGWLIEQCGWKGKRVKHCGVHARQALVLVNYGGASGSEIYDLSESVQKAVFETFGIQLEREVNII